MSGEMSGVHRTQTQYSGDVRTCPERCPESIRVHRTQYSVLRRCPEPCPERCPEYTVLSTQYSGDVRTCPELCPERCPEYTVLSTQYSGDVRTCPKLCPGVHRTQYSVLRRCTPNISGDVRSTPYPVLSTPEMSGHVRSYVRRDVRSTPYSVLSTPDMSGHVRSYVWRDTVYSGHLRTCLRTCPDISGVLSTQYGVLRRCPDILSGHVRTCPECLSTQYVLSTPDISLDMSGHLRSTEYSVRCTPEMSGHVRSYVRSTMSGVHRTQYSVLRRCPDMSGELCPGDVRSTVPYSVLSTPEMSGHVRRDVRRDVRSTPYSVLSTPEMSGHVRVMSRCPEVHRTQYSVLRRCPDMFGRCPADVQRCLADIRRCPVDVRKCPADVQRYKEMFVRSFDPPTDRSVARSVGRSISRSVGRSFGCSFICVEMTSETHGLVDALLYFDRGYDEFGVRDMCDALDASICV
jgi:hypothetical protein